MTIPEGLPIVTQERREVATLGKRITELAALDRALDKDEVTELMDAIERVAWVAGNPRCHWTGGEA